MSRDVLLDPEKKWKPDIYFFIFEIKKEGLEVARF